MAKNAKSYPLAWPDGRPRAKAQQGSKFGERTLAKTLQVLKDELQRLGAGNVVISTNVPLKDDGDPYSNPGRMKDPGVAVYFWLNGKAYCLPCDRWNSVEDNLYAVAKHVEAMRGMERWGVGSVEQTFSGFREVAASAEPDWWTELSISKQATLEQIQAAYRIAARKAHPDQGGSTAAMQRLNIARDAALSYRKAVPLG